MGLGGDSSVATWVGGLILVGSAIASATYANDYCRAFEGNPRTPKSQNHSYYTAQYVRVLGSLTAGFAFLYVAWTFVDSRHPSKTRLWAFSAERLQQARLQAKKSHMQKLAAVEGILAVMWIPPVFILMFRGWIYRRQTTNGTKAHAICTSRVVANCHALRDVGVATLITAIIVLLLFVVTLVPCTVKPGAKTPEQLAAEAAATQKKEDEEDRLAGNRIRRAFGLPELSETEYADMKKNGNSQQCWGFKGFGQGANYSTGWSMGGGGGFAGGGFAGGGGWSGWGGGVAAGGGGGGPIILGGNGGNTGNGGNSPAIINMPIKQVYTPYYRKSRNRYRKSRRGQSQPAPSGKLKTPPGPQPGQKTPKPTTTKPPGTPILPSSRSASSGSSTTSSGSFSTPSGFSRTRRTAGPRLHFTF